MKLLTTDNTYEAQLLIFQKTNFIKLNLNTGNI